MMNSIQTEKLHAIVERQKPEARFVIMSNLLGMDIIEFDALAKQWIEHGSLASLQMGFHFAKSLVANFTYND